MFVGHFAVGLAAKRVAPRASLGTYFVAALFLDLVWPVFLLLGIEKIVIVPGLTAFTPIDFTYPWSHSLLAAAVWSLVFAGAHYAIRKDRPTAAVLSGVVFSHWVLDWVMHRPDLPLAPGLPIKTGLGLWNSVPGTLTVELLLFGACVFWYGRGSGPLDGVGRWAWIALIAALLVSYAAVAVAKPAPGQESQLAYGSFATWVFIPWAAWVDRHRTMHA